MYFIKYQEIPVFCYFIKHLHKSCKIIHIPNNTCFYYRAMKFFSVPKFSMQKQITQNNVNRRDQDFSQHWSKHFAPFTITNKPFQTALSIQQIIYILERKKYRSSMYFKIPNTSIPVYCHPTFKLVWRTNFKLF